VGTQKKDNGWPEKSREVRLGLVMYGGVSLAIYINGVAQELFRAVHGRGIYRLIKALTDSDIVVDVLSGTSAGDQRDLPFLCSLQWQGFSALPRTSGASTGTYSLIQLSLRAPKAGLGVFLGLGALSLFALSVGLFF
jgi:hypothetical protein